MKVPFGNLFNNPLAFFRSFVAPLTTFSAINELLSVCREKTALRVPCTRGEYHFNNNIEGRERDESAAAVLGAGPFS